MKNLLVDALRQADGTKEASPETTEEAKAPASAAPPGRELQLLGEEAGEPAAAAPQAADEVEVETPDASLRQGADLELDPELAAPADASSLAVESTAEPAVSVEPAHTAASKVSDREVASAAGAGLFRAGRWLPVLYVATVATAAGAYVGVQRLNAPAVVADIGVMPVQRSEIGLPAEPKTVWSALAEPVEPRAAVEDAESNQGGAKYLREQRTSASSNDPPTDMQSSRGRAELLEADSADALPADPALAEVQAAHAAYAIGDYAAAERFYRQALRKDAHHRHALSGLAAVLEHRGRISEAIEVYERVLRTDPGDVEAATRLAAAVQTSDRHGAETKLKLLAQRYPAAPFIQSALGNLYASQRRWPEAHEAFVAALALAPEQADVLYNVAVTADQLGKHETARRHYLAALEFAATSASFPRTEAEARLAALPVSARSRQ